MLLEPVLQVYSANIQMRPLEILYGRSKKYVGRMYVLVVHGIFRLYI
jgi:hypothetical protein